MTISADKHRFVVVIEKEILKKFQELARAKESRSASNLAAKLIKDYVEKNV
jgi:metal-responsive CopG/Arc/MetJ family transcriptional regulator